MKNMNQSCVWVPVIAGVLVVLVACDAPASEEGHYAADQVSLDSYYDFMDNWLFTHVGDNRGPSGPEHDPARDNIHDLFESYGLDVELDEFTWFGGTYENVVATKLGTLYPDQEYIIGAHYDSVSNPGADDDASGVALMLEVARIISQYDSDYTIRFIAFDMEEQGLVGSEHYVDEHYMDDILGMISADMVAYDPDTNHANIYGRSASNPIKNALADAVDEYGDGLTYTIGGDTPYSDHAPFEAEGFQACLWIEGEVWNNPYYHTQQDSFEQPGNLNFEYAVKMTRSILGWLVDQAGVQVVVDGLAFSFPDGRPDIVDPDGGTVMRVEVSGVANGVPQPGTGVLHFVSGSSWESVPMVEVADNVYDAVFPAAACGTYLRYYVSAVSMAGNTFTDPESAPSFYYRAPVGYAWVAAIDADMESDPGWTSQGQWAFGQPTGGGTHNGDPQSGYTGSTVYGYNLNGDYANNLSATYLTTGPADCSGQFQVALEFERWLGVESEDGFDEATIEISTNGEDWEVIWRATDTGASIADAEWTFQSLDVSDLVDDASTVYVRWGMGPTDTSVTYPGWNIDDVRLVGLACGPAVGDGDYDRDGDVDLFDFGEFQRCFAVSPMPDGCAPGDLNGDDAVDLADHAALTDVLGGPQ
jgi:hypothetical protein